MVYAILLWILTDSASAGPGITFPVNSQVPPVARVARPFQFCFSASTFSSTSSSIQYSLVEPPKWLHFDSASRTFSGTPGAGDVGAAEFDLVATDETGTASMPVTFVVSSEQGPGLGVPTTGQLSTLGTFSAPDNLVFYPSSPMSISFRPDTFTNTNSNTIYYAICANNTPLPSWIHFDPRGLSFMGNTPGFSSEYELPQRVGIHLIASDVVGFSGVSAFFNIVVESHELTLANGSLSIQVIAGENVSFNGIKSALRLDGQPIESTDIKSVTAETPPWLTLDASSLTISGVAPRGFTPQSFPVAVVDIYGNCVNTTIIMSVGSATGLIHGTVAPLNAILGTAFMYQFDHSLFNSGSTIQLDLGNSSSWLEFDAAALQITGQVPTNLEPQTDHLNLTASQGTVLDFQIVTLLVSRKQKSTTTLPSTLSPSSTSSTRPVGHGPTTQASQDIDRDTDGNKQRIAAAIVLPIVVLLAMLLIGLWIRKRRCRANLQKRQRISRHQIRGPESRRLSKAPQIDFKRDRGMSDLQEPQSKQRYSTTDPSKRGSAQIFMRPWSKIWNSSTDKSDRLDELDRNQYSIAEDKQDRSKAGVEPSVSLSHHRVFGKPTVSGLNASYQYTRRSSQKTSALGTSLRLHGFGHGYPVAAPSIPGRDISCTNRQNSNMGSMLASKSDRDWLNRQRSAQNDHGVARVSHKNKVTREESVGWYTVSDGATISTDHDKHSTPNSRPTTQATFINENSNDKPTVRAIGAPNEIKLSPKKSRENYYKERRKHPQTHSALFSGNTSIRKTSSSTTQNLYILQNSSSWTDDDPYTFNDKENLGSSLGRTPSSARGKGKMLQHSFSFSPLSYGPKRRTGATGSRLGYGVPPKLSHFQSRSSLASSRRFEDAESEIPSDIDEDEYIFEEQQEQGEGGARRTWVHAKHENPLHAHNDSSVTDTRLPRSGQRWSILETRKGLVRKEAEEKGEEEGGEMGCEEKDRKLVLGERGKRPVSVENILDRVRGAPGSKSFRAEAAFI